MLKIQRFYIKINLNEKSISSSFSHPGSCNLNRRLPRRLTKRLPSRIQSLHQKIPQENRWPWTTLLSCIFIQGFPLKNGKTQLWLHSNLENGNQSILWPYWWRIHCHLFGRAFIINQAHQARRSQCRIPRRCRLENSRHRYPNQESRTMRIMLGFCCHCRSRNLSNPK